MATPRMLTKNDLPNVSFLLDTLSIFEDSRVQGRTMYRLIDILCIVVIARLAGAKTFSAIGDYAKMHELEVSQLLNLENGVPSHDTIMRVMQLIDPTVFQECFVTIVESLREQVQDQNAIKQHIAVDGKVRRNSSSSDHADVKMVAAWSVNEKVVLGQTRVVGGGSEFVAIPKLLDTINIANSVLTMDAAGCYKSIVEKIAQKDADYILALKNNQPNLFKDCVDYFQDQEIFDGVIHEESDKGHGRHEKRVCYATSKIEWLRKNHDWAKLKSIVMVQSTVTKKGKATHSTRYFISSLPADDAAFLNHTIRAHWSIENELHWTLDVIFGQDTACIRNERAAENMSYIDSWVVSILKQLQKPHQSLASVTRYLGSWKYMSAALKLIFDA